MNIVKNQGEVLSLGSALQMELYRSISRPDDADTSFAALLQDVLVDELIKLGTDIPCLQPEDPRFTVISKDEMRRIYANFEKMYHTGTDDFENHVFQWAKSEQREDVDGVPQSINFVKTGNGWWNIEMGFGSKSSDAMRKKLFDKITVFKNPNARFNQPQNYSVVMASIQPEDNPMEIQKAMLRKISACVSPIALGAFGLDISFGSPQKPEHIDS